MAVDIAVDDYSKGKQITTWVRVKSSKDQYRDFDIWCAGGYFHDVAPEERKLTWENIIFIWIS